MRRTVLIVTAGVLLASGGLFAFQSWRQASARRDELDQSFERASALAQSEDGLSKAKLELDRALLLAPDDYRLLKLRGEVLWSLGRFDDAMRDARHAVEVSEGSERAKGQALLGRCFAERYRGAHEDADYRGAQSSFLDAELDPAAEAEAMDGFAMLLLERATKGKKVDVDDLEKAAKKFEQLLQKHADYQRAAAIREMLPQLKAIVDQQKKSG